MYVITNNFNKESTPSLNQNLGQFPAVWQCNIRHPSIMYIKSCIPTYLVLIVLDS